MAKKFKTTDAQPLSIDRYINLVTDKKLRKPDIVRWFQCVTRHGPPGVLKPVSMQDGKQRPASVSLVHRVSDDRHNYLIPLTRDLTDSEVEAIAREFAEDKPKLDFDIETNATTLTANNCGGIELDSAKHLALCNLFAKQKHEDWVRERTDAGWRYGTKFDANEQTHPLLRPWDQLPDRYRQPDLTWPQKLVQLLNDQGYAVVPKDELARLLDVLRDTVSEN